MGALLSRAYVASSMTHWRQMWRGPSWGTSACEFSASAGVRILARAGATAAADGGRLDTTPTLPCWEPRRVVLGRWGIHCLFSHHLADIHTAASVLRGATGRVLPLPRSRVQCMISPL
ncbi:hypothetical protein I4F81_010038 [Pyropia yezoensis]|uniref:Uncharacterized protein n=1 Tax=Pyropia yezoensis TaxID=2788 RepID=A0ACC3CCP8_PYRYE|nr:hypothetical protein I4F81_010038 [Neopyropia yezoensis]